MEEIEVATVTAKCYQPPRGVYYDADGASYVALGAPGDWFWHALNSKAALKGYNGQDLFDHLPIMKSND